MGFEVERTPAGAGNWRLAIGLVAIFAAGLLGLALVSRPAPPVAQMAMSVDGATLLSEAMPPQLDCHDLDAQICHEATRAALTLFSPSRGAIRSADAWKSLL